MSLKKYKNKLDNSSIRLSYDNTEFTNLYVKSGDILLQDDYPELYEKIGLINKPGVVTTVTDYAGSVYEMSADINNNIFAAEGSNITRSTDGITWTTVNSFGNIVEYFHIDEDLYVAVGGGGVIKTSTNGITWDTRTSGTTQALRAIIRGDLYVAIGGGGVILSSTDAITWTTRTSGTATQLYAGAYGNGVYVAAGDSGVILSSTDAITWTTRTSGITTRIRGAAYDNNLFYLAPWGPNGSVGSRYGGLFLNSTDGITWNNTNINGITLPEHITVKDNKMLITGSNGAFISYDYGDSFNLIDAGTQSISFYGGVILEDSCYVCDSVGRILKIENYDYDTSTEFRVPDNEQFYFNTYIKA